MLPILINMGWAASGATAVAVTPSYYHAVEGPSRKLKTLEGATAEPHILEGPSQKLRQLTGCN